MHKGFTKLTLGLVGAALLSSSAFAVGPTLKRLPDVYITGKTKNPAQTDQGTNPSGSTDIYQFTDAFLLQDYVEFADLNAVQWEFRELDETMTPVTVGQTISINGAVGAASLPDYASITSGGGVVGAESALDFINVALTPDLAASGTPPTGGVDQATIEVYVAANTVADEVDVAAFDVFTTNDDNVAAFDLASAPSSIYNCVTGISDFENWFVETKVGAGITPGTFSPALEVAKLDSIDLGNAGAFIADFDAAPASTASVTINTTASGGAASAGNALQYVTWASSRNDLAEDGTSTRIGGIPVSADTVYMARWTISSDALTTAAGRSASTQLPNVRLRMGENGPYGNGNISHEFPDNGINGIIGNDQILRTYFYAKDDYSSGGVNISQAEMNLYFDILDLYAPDTDASNGSNTIAGAATPNGQRDYGLTLSQVEVFSFSRDDLSGATVEFNNGASVVNVASGEEAPSSNGLVDFDAGTWGFFEGQADAGDRVTNSVSASAISFVVSQTSSSTATDGFYITADTENAADETVGEVVTVSNDRLVIIDAYVSTDSTSAGTTDNALMGRGIVSGIRLGMQTAAFVPSTSSIPAVAPQLNFDNDPAGALYDTTPALQGRGGFMEFSATNTQAFSEGGSQPPQPYALETASKRVSYIFEPLATDAPATGDALSFRPVFEIYSFPAFSRDDADALAPFVSGDGPDVSSAFNAGTINLNRVVITSYDLPADPEACN